MTTNANYRLSSVQISHFMRHGWVRVPQCFSREKAAEWTADVWNRLGFSPSDKSTWTTEITYMHERRSESVKTFAPKAWAAICELLGGEKRVAEHSSTWNDAFIVNLGTEKSAGKWYQPEELTDWHVDGDFFVHFLDSPEQALLVIPLFSDIQERSGGTMVCSDSIELMARYLYGHPEGVSPFMVPRGSKQSRQDFDDFYDDMIQKCHQFFEMTGKTGDVILLHPLMVHSVSINSLRQPRIITNPPVSLKEPFKFDRSNPDHYSLVERFTLKSLGKDRLRGWKIKGRRESVTPERMKPRVEEIEQGMQRGRSAPARPKSGRKHPKIDKCDMV